MLMTHSHAKKMAVLGILAALSAVLLVLGTVISVNTVFFTALASFLVGIAVVLYGIRYGTVFYLVCGALDFLLNPDKLHVILYLGFAGYILVSEGTYLLLKKITDPKKKEWIHRAVRLVVFALLYIPAVVLVPQMFISGEWLIKENFFLMACGAGVVGWIIFDLAYGVCKNFIWRHMKNTISSM